MTYCPLCEPEIGMSEDGEWVVVRYYPESEIDTDNIEINTFNADTGLHITVYAWFNGFEHTDENALIYERFHPIKDWEAKHMMNQSSVDKEIENVLELI